MIDAGPNNLVLRVRKILADSPIWEIRQLRVEQRGDSVCLEGRVCSFYHKQLAQETIRRAARELPIINELTVE